MASAAKYAQDESGESERPLKVCAEAGRKCVRSIHQYPILSRDWMTLVDHLKQLSRLVQLEGRMPANSKVAEAKGRNTETEGTLWDQEAHENAIRILVEEAKVNLCLRMMNDYKRWSYDADGRNKTLQEAMQETEQPESQLEAKALQYEECLGTLLWRAFVHVETLQLMDIPLLIEHCALILNWTEKASVDSMPANTKMQEYMVLYYFSSLMKHAEALNNSELLAKSREYRLLPLVTFHVHNYGDKYPMDMLCAVGDGLAALADNEDFSTEWELFFEDASDAAPGTAKANFLQLEDLVAKKILDEFPARKKEIRPLLDLFQKIKKRMK